MQTTHTVKYVKKLSGCFSLLSSFVSSHVLWHKRPPSLPGSVGAVSFDAAAVFHRNLGRKYPSKLLFGKQDGWQIPFLFVQCFFKGGKFRSTKYQVPAWKPKKTQNLDLRNDDIETYSPNTHKSSMVFTYSIYREDNKNWQDQTRYHPPGS